MKTQTKQKQCLHFWVIEPPDGATSFGRCKFCGMVKEFINDWEDTLEIVGKRHHDKQALIKSIVE